jgi:GGDEF domain-containing protein
VAKANCTKRVGEFADFLRLIEQEASFFPVELIPVAEKDGTGQQGFLALDSALAEGRKKALAKAVNGGSVSRKNQPHMALIESQHGMAEHENFKSTVHSELDRVKKSRLPCSLLLTRINDAKDKGCLGKALAALKKEMQAEAHLGHYDNETLAILLPGLNKNRALIQARAIHETFTAKTAARVTSGLAVCVARAVPSSADLFINMAVKELLRADHEEGEIFYSSEDAVEDGCQVSVEERAQLFSFLSSRGKVTE